MPSVSTVRGEIDDSQLGATLMPEHVFVLGTEFQDNYVEYWDEKQITTMLVDNPRVYFGGARS